MTALPGRWARGPQVDMRAAFAPFLPELNGCVCPTCYATGAAVYTIRLGMVRAGVHRRMTIAESAAAACEIKADRLAHMRATGASAAEIEIVERGYVKVPLGGMIEGWGVGIGGRIQ